MLWLASAGSHSPVIRPHNPDPIPSLSELRRNLASVLILAVPDVIRMTFSMDRIVATGSALALPVALILAALISATDPVAVVALFRSLRVPHRR